MKKIRRVFVLILILILCVLIKKYVNEKALKKNSLEFLAEEAMTGLCEKEFYREVFDLTREEAVMVFSDKRIADREV